MAQRGNQSDLKLDNLTREDLKKIERSMKQPGFMGLLNEYMVEISDPKNKNEYDEYLRQMEREHELPKHMKIVEVKPVFCFRTFIVSQKNKKHEMKFFVNMCESEYLDKPTCEAAEGGGYNWKVPNSMGKIRYDQDKKGNPCQVVDIAFHQDTFYFAGRKEFKEMIVNIALEAAEKQLGERKETLSRDYVILQNVKCKGVDGKPALMPMRYIQGRIYNKGEGPTNEPERDLEGRETKLQKEINKQKEEFEREKEKDVSKEEDRSEDVEEEARPLVVDLDSGVQRPKYSTILTYPVDYSEFIDGPFAARRKVPSAFNLEVQIPRVESVEEVAGQTLEINEKRVVLQIAEKYFLDLEWADLKLKYVLVTGSAKAKYDKKKKCLRITIPIDQSVKYESEPEPEQKLVQPLGDHSPEVLENETWKNKVLEFSDPNVSVKVLATAQEEEESAKVALVQEIEEEDIIEQKPETGRVLRTEEEQETVAKPAQKFTVGSYYKKDKVVGRQGGEGGRPEGGKGEGESRRLGHVFQETADKVVVVFQLKNYKKEEVKALANKSEILVLWSASPCKYEHLKVGESLGESVVKVEVVFRVGFIAVMLGKAESAKGKYFQKESLIEVEHEGGSSEEQLGQFIRYFEFVEQRDREQREQRERELREQREREQREQRERKEAAQSATLPQSNQPKPAGSKPSTQEQQAERREIEEQLAQKGKQVLGRAVQAQFIEFRTGFAEQLD